MKNSNLHQAKKAKNDEFYTQLTDIEKELVNYVDFFAGKTVYCNCDDARESNFFKYFSNRFEELGLKKLIATGYKENGKGVALVYEGDKNGNHIVDNEEIKVTELKGDGDFRSDECIEFLKEADVVVTNPPFSCYSFDTEVLTNNGWKFIKDVNIDSDLIYSLNPKTNNIEIIKVVDFLKSPVNGQLYHYHSRNMDFAVTGNHKMYTHYKGNNGDNKYKGLVSAEDIKKSDLLKLNGFEWEGVKRDYFVLPKTTQKEQYTRKEIVIDEKHIPIGDWCEFFGFWLADGCTRCGNNTQGNPRYTVSIKQNVNNEEYVINLYKKIGFDCKISKKNDNNNNYTVYSKQLWEYLQQFGKSRDKFIPTELLELDKENLNRLFTGYINGDSTKGNGDIVLSSTSKLLMDNMQELLLKLFGNIYQVCTVNGTYKNEPYVYYKISLQRNLIHRDFAKYGEPEMIDYNDYVYCLTLEKNHIMLTRHNGVIGWCGNCFREYVAQLMEYDKKFLIIGNMNAITYKEIFPLIRDNRLWAGVNSKGGTRKGNSLSFQTENGEMKDVSSWWFTNIENKRHQTPLDLYKRYTPEEYPKYDNYDAINVNKSSDIPIDYDGVIGVPISFLMFHCPEQFEIVSFRKGEDGKDLVFTRERERVQPYFRILVRRISRE